MKLFCGCDDSLLEALNSIIQLENRTVSEIEKLKMLNSNKYYHERIPKPRLTGKNARNEWHQKGINFLKGCELVFLDPDNGMLPKSISRESDKSIKYVFAEEVLAYYETGASVAIYSHRTREQQDLYLTRFESLFNEARKKEAVIKGVSFKRGTIRDYFFLIHEEHLRRVEKGIIKITSGQWSKHFEELEIKT